MVSEYLMTGAENATASKDLCIVIGLTRRELEREIMTERRQGVPICASCNGLNPGYYLADDRETMESYCKTLRQRMGEIAKTYRALKGCIDTLPERGGWNEFKA